MSDSLFFFITTVYILWVAISGAKAKQKRAINAAKLAQPGLRDLDDIAFTDKASLPYDDIQPVYEPQQPDQHHDYNHSHSDIPVTSDTSEHSADLKNLPLNYERKQKQVV